MALALTVILPSLFKLITVPPFCVTFVGVVPSPIVTVQLSFAFTGPVPIEEDSLTVPTTFLTSLAQIFPLDIQIDITLIVSSGYNTFFFNSFFLINFFDIITITSYFLYIKADIKNLKSASN